MRKWQSKQKAIFFRGLSVLLNSGVHIVGALDCLAVQALDEDSQASVLRMASRVSSGFPLHKAMGAEKVFSELEVSLVKVGERSGSLHNILLKLATVAEEQESLRRKFGAALVYPAFVLTLCTLLLIFAPVLVFSDLLNLLAELKTELPLATRLYLGFSELVTSPLAYLVVLVLACLAFFWGKRLLEDENLRSQSESLLMEVPGFGGAFTSCVSAEVSAALATAYSSGLPLLEALKLSSEVSISVYLKRQLAHSLEMLRGGDSLSNALASTGFFSPMALLMLQGGEEVGMVAESLQSVAVENSKATKLALETMQKLLEPCLLLFVGSVVGFISIATLAPTIKMVEGL